MKLCPKLLFLAFFLCLCACMDLAGASSASACYPGTAFREYLSPDFWGPYRKNRMLEMPAMPRSPIWDKRAFAGMNTETLPKAGAAYRDSRYDDALELVAQVLEGSRDGMVHEEAALLAAKCRLRKLGLSVMEEHPVDPAALADVEQLFEEFIESASDEYYRREARGWLAHVHVLQGRKDKAISYYLGQLADPRSIYTEETLWDSLSVCNHDLSRRRWMLQNLDLYMHRPEYALWAIHAFTTGRLCDQGYADKIRRAFIAAAARHSDLFFHGEHSAELVLALMRAALFTGNLRVAMAYGDNLPEPIPPHLVPEFMWMRACCAFLWQDYHQAEKYLMAMRDAPAADRSVRMRAWMGLMGVYYKLDKPVEHLHAIIKHAEIEILERPVELPMIDTIAYGYAPYSLNDEYNRYRYVMYADDLPYFLDARLTIDQLKTYLERYGDDSLPSLRQLVTFALAVHLGREEQYTEAVEVLERLYAEAWKGEGNNPEVRTNVGGYCVRYKKAGELYEDAFHGIKFSSMARLEAQYQYGHFLYQNPDHIFFNRTLWSGLQHVKLSVPTWHTPCPGPDCYKKLRDRDGHTIFCIAPFYTDQDVKAIAKQNRRLQDTQEERWRAANLLMEVARKAGYTPIGRKAVSIAMDSLHNMNQWRFGRERELQDNLDLLIHWPWQIPEDSK